jgi:hypothetical protein
MKFLVAAFQSISGKIRDETFVFLKGELSEGGTNVENVFTFLRGGSTFGGVCRDLLNCVFFSCDLLSRDGF